MNITKHTYKIYLFACACILFSSCLKEYDNPAEGVVNNKADVYVVRDAYKGSEVVLSSATLAGANFTYGVVISDKDGANIAPGSFVIQSTKVTGNQTGDQTRGIVIDMGSSTAVPYVPGDSLLINIEGAKLDRINGRLTISGVTTGKIEKLASGSAVIVRPVTLEMLKAEFDEYESTLVSVHADITDFSSSTTYSGERPLNDNTAATVFLRTRNDATFAGTPVPVNAQFTGIAAWHNETGKDTVGAKQTISIRTINDVQFSSGAIYAGFPERFESPDFTQKASYNMTATANNVDLSTGNWKLQQALLGNTVIRDKYNIPGSQCVRMQQNLSTSALVQMNFDLPQGASKVTVFYGKYYTDPASTFRLEYSINGGTNWIQVGTNVNDMPDRGFKQATFTMNILVPVRIRINKLGLGASSPTVQNGRLCIDDIAIYKAL
jgi:hypothetical protein